MSDENPNLHVEFFMHPVEDKKESAKLGRPFFKDVEYVQIKFPGDNKRVLSAPASECARNHPVTGEPWSYAERYPKHYEAFKSNQEYLGEGTPISELPFLTTSQRVNLRSQNVHTAEALAAIDGSQLSSLGMGARDMKTKAVAYLERANEAAGDSELMAQNKALLARIEALEAGSGIQQPEAQAPSAVPDESKSPFEDWDDEAIKTYLKENGGKIPPGTSKHSTLVAKADELNKELADKAA